MQKFGLASHTINIGGASPASTSCFPQWDTLNFLNKIDQRFLLLVHG